MCAVLGIQVWSPSNTDPDWPMQQNGYGQGILSLALPGVMQASAATEDEDWAFEEPSEPTLGTQISPGEEPQILLYCSHSNEAYKNQEPYTYTPNGTARTLDQKYNVMSIASSLTNLLRDQYNLPAMFDGTDHELGKYYNQAYNRSLASIESLKEKYPSLCVFIDIHRDAYTSATTDCVMVDGKQAAKISVVIGTGEGYTGGFSVRPQWEENKKFADALYQEINELAPGMGRKVSVKTGRYNQHISTMSILIEVGYHENTYDQVQVTLPYLAHALNNVLTGE